MTTNESLAAIQEAQARVADLMTANERLREEREAARATVDLLLHENAALEQSLSDARARIDRLMLHLQQGVEL